MQHPPIHREWVDWARPFVPAAARWLLDRARDLADESRSGLRSSDSWKSRIVDLSTVVCVTPGKRGGRVLLEALLRECDREGLTLHPPRFITPGVLPEVLGRPAEPAPSASPEEACMAWIHALQRCDAQTLRPLVAKLPAEDDLLAWYALARLIQRLHNDLAGGMRSFADVADRAARMELFGESDRWHVLAHVHTTYLEVLASTHLVDLNETRSETLRESNAPPASAVEDGIDEVILLGVVDLNAMQRAVLSRAHRVAALIHAPEELCRSFDEFGCVVDTFWNEREIVLNDAHIVVADQPDDQAQAVLECLAQRAGAAVDSITIGLGDESLGESLERAADWAGVRIHRAEARTLADTGPYRLLDGLAEWIGEQRFAPFAALLRHPDVERWLSSILGEQREGVRDWISLLDRYFTEHLHVRLTSPWLGDSDLRMKLKRIHDAIRTLASPLLDQPKVKPLGDWSSAVLQVLQQVYGRPETMAGSEWASHTSNPLAACIEIRDQLAAIALIDASLQPACDAATALRLVLSSCADAALPSPLRDDQIEALGWLELHLDAAPTLIVMGVNDGQIPASMSADVFLPDTLRAALGLACNASRYARDAYLLEAMSRSREHLTLIAGRRGAEGDPLAPSRLLLATNRETLPERVLRLSDEKRALRRLIPRGAPSALGVCEFRRFEPPIGPHELTRMRVTAFKEYLKCPLRWWLRNVAKIESVGDAAVELDPLRFGSLAHEVLEQFGRDEEVRESTRSAEIADWLAATLADTASRWFGDHPPPAVRIQLDRLKRRLEGFARFQAGHRATGWVICECELKLQTCTLDVPGQEPLTVTGTIDRIDRHEDRDAIRIIDYKTGDSGETPFLAHHGATKYREDSWNDLQLPLYRHLAAQCGYGGPEVELGYVTLPKHSDRADLLIGEWTSEQLDEAIDKARWVVMQIRSGSFPMKDGGMYDEFENICQTHVLGRRDEVEVDA